MDSNILTDMTNAALKFERDARGKGSSDQARYFRECRNKVLYLLGVASELYRQKESVPILIKRNGGSYYEVSFTDPSERIRYDRINSFSIDIPVLSSDLFGAFAEIQRTTTPTLTSLESNEKILIGRENVNARLESHGYRLTASGIEKISEEGVVDEVVSIK